MEKFCPFQKCLTPILCQSECMAMMPKQGAGDEQRKPFYLRRLPGDVHDGEAGRGGDG